MLLAAAITIGLQAAPVQTPANAVQGVPAQDLPGQDPAAVQRRRNQIQIMEGVLARAVRSGAEDLARRMQRRDPGLMLFTGQARARGFVLDGYGVFFDVEIPALRPTVVWSIQTLERDTTMASAIDSLQKALMSLPDNARRDEAERALKYVQQLGPPLPGRSQATNTGLPITPTTADPAALDDPHTSYTEAVKNALIDAMLDYSIAMDLGADEWFTVAARDSEGPLTPDEIYDPSTILLRVKGSDLATYAADRSRRSEVRARVKVTDF
jgi:hypothetical protein